MLSLGLAFKPFVYCSVMVVWRSWSVADRSTALLSVPR